MLNIFSPSSPPPKVPLEGGAVQPPPTTHKRSRRESLTMGSSTIVSAQELCTAFSRKELESLYSQFRKLANKTGTLDKTAFRSSLGSLGMVEDTLLCDRLFSVFNRSKTNLITFGEFAEGLSVLMKGTIDEKLDFAFRMADIDGSESISFDEMVLMLESMCRMYSGMMGLVYEKSFVRFDQSRVRHVFNQLDTDGSGSISLEEYKRGMKKYPEFVAFLFGTDLWNNMVTQNTPTHDKDGVKFRESVLRISTDLNDKLTALKSTLSLQDDNLDASLALVDSLMSLTRQQGMVTLPPAPLPVAATVRLGGGVGEGMHSGRKLSQLSVNALDTTPASNSNNNNGDPSYDTPDADIRKSMLERHATNRSAPDFRLQARLRAAEKGNTLFFGHKNWDLVVNVMKGIQMAVGRSAVDLSTGRGISKYDYYIKEKYSPSSTCRFIDYAPFVFGKLRERFGINNDMYVRSIGPGNMVSNLWLGSLNSLAELGSEGKSGSFFYLTSDGKFLIKTVRKDEHKLLRRILPEYVEHMMSSIDPSGGGGDGDVDAAAPPSPAPPESLLTRILGCHVVRVSTKTAGKMKSPQNNHNTEGSSVISTTGGGSGSGSTRHHRSYVRPMKRSGSRKVYFIVMENCLNCDLSIHRRYDLKGSWVGRRTPKEKRGDAKVTLKDQDFVELRERVCLTPHTKDLLIRSLARDAAFLDRQNIIDYSVLLGIHDHTLTRNVVEWEQEAKAIAAGEGVPEGQQRSFFRSHFGGVLAGDGRQTYVLGVIDFLTQYGTFKRFERFAKTMLFLNPAGISVMPAKAYAHRFVRFFETNFVTGDIAPTPPSVQQQEGIVETTSFITRDVEFGNHVEQQNIHDPDLAEAATNGVVDDRQVLLEVPQT